MGPRASARGNASAPEGSEPYHALQWGRARPHAEIPSRRSWAANAWSCFNGAARVRTRKCGVTAPQAWANALLQWGRARPHAEICLPQISSCSPDRLQWGRARPHAEISVTDWFETPEQIELQWGRARPHAEIQRRRGAAKLGRFASMGPRASARGNREHGAMDYIDKVLQWGRARPHAEIRSGQDRFADVQSSFNGAARVRTRK